MKRLTKPYKNIENGKYINIFPDCTLGEIVERLAYYEDLEEQGRLIILDIEDIHPCKHCDVGWGSISSEGCKTCYDTCERLKQYNDKYRT